MPKGHEKFDVVWKIGGEAGNGIMVIGSIFARVALRSGLSVFDYQEFPSLIRGGHNVYQVRASNAPIHSQSPVTDVLVALNRETIDRHLEEIVPGGVLLYDGNEVHLEDKHIKKGIHLLQVPFLQIARDVAGERLMMNTVALGASARAMGIEFAHLASVIKDTFGGKGAKVVELNTKCAKAGFDYADKNFGEVFHLVMPNAKTKDTILVTGLEAMALGALKAGMKFYSAYPMTPATGFLTYYAGIAEEYSLVVKQTEDEISALNMAVGAGYAGVRSMVATSGGGFSLMVEALGLAGMTETPVVIVNGMRGGPSTGLPTWTEQGDLLFVKHASQGDFPRVVVAPGDMEECFTVATEVFNWAEMFQIPVIMLIDRYMAESHASIPNFAKRDVKIIRSTMFDDKHHSSDEAAERYEVTHSGVSPRLVPGISKAIFNVSSDEHDEFGSINEESDNRIRQMNKRMGKLHELSALLPKPKMYGPRDADITIIAWGSTKMPVLDALTLLEEQGISVNFLHLTYLHPFPTDAVKEHLKNAKRTLMIEGNYTGQAEAILKQETLHEPDFRFRKFDGRPFYADEIVAYTKQSLASTMKR